MNPIAGQHKATKVLPQLDLVKRLDLFKFLHVKLWFKKEGSGKFILTATILTVCSGLIQYLDLILEPIFHLSKIKLNNQFVTLQQALYNFEYCISGLLLIIGYSMKPYWFANIVPIYAFMNVFIGYIFVAFGYTFDEVTSMFAFRVVLFLFVVITFIALTNIKVYISGVFLIEELKSDLINTNKKTLLDDE